MKRKSLYIVLLGLTMGSYAWLAWNVAQRSGNSALPAVCLFKEITGLPCPSCGTTRSVLLLMNGDLRGSLLTNPFGAAAALALLAVPLWILADIVRKRDSFYRSYVGAERFFMQNKWSSAFAVAIVALNWFWNIMKAL